MRSHFAQSLEYTWIPVFWLLLSGHLILLCIECVWVCVYSCMYSYVYVVAVESGAFSLGLFGRIEEEQIRDQKLRPEEAQFHTALERIISCPSVFLSVSNIPIPPQWLPLDQWLCWPMRRGCSTQSSSGLSCFLLSFLLLQLPHHESVGPKRERISHNLWINSPLCPWCVMERKSQCDHSVISTPRWKLTRIGRNHWANSNIMMAPLHNRQDCQSSIFSRIATLFASPLSGWFPQGC